MEGGELKVLMVDPTGTSGPEDLILMILPPPLLHPNDKQPHEVPLIVLSSFPQCWASIHFDVSEKTCFL